MNDSYFTTQKMKILKSGINEYKELCLNSDKISQDEKSPTGSYFIKGWVDISRKYDSKTQFKAVAYNKGYYVVIAYVGTNFMSLKDIWADLKMTFTATKQMKQANEFFNDIKKSLPKAEIILTGHSEGGSEAQYVCTVNGGVPTFTFNPYMIGSLFSKEIRNRILPFIYNYRHKNDIVSKLGLDIGYQFIAGAGKKCIFKNVHQLENIGDLTKAKLAKSSAYNINLIHVKSYKRADGKVVKGYCRKYANIS